MTLPKHHIGVTSTVGVLLTVLLSFSARAEGEEAAPAPVASKAEVGVACADVDMGLLTQLKAKSQALIVREQELIERENGLKRIDEQVGKKLADMEAIVARLEERLQIGEAARAAEVRRADSMVAAVASLSAKKAAPLLSGSTPEFALLVLAKLQPDQAGQILTQMEPAKAATLLQYVTARSGSPAPRNAK